MIIFAVLTVCDCLWRLVHCWYSLGRPVKIGTTMVIFAVLTVFWLFVTVSTIGSLHCCDCCTNRHKQSKTVKWHDDDDVREILFVVDKLSRHRPRHGGVQCRHRFAGCGQSIFPVEFSCRLHPYEHLAVGCAVYHLRHLLPHPLRHDDVESFLCCRTDSLTDNKCLRAFTQWQCLTHVTIWFAAIFRRLDIMLGSLRPLRFFGEREDSSDCVRRTWLTSDSTLP